MSRADFLVANALRVSAIDLGLIKMINNHFNYLDKDGSGFLNIVELLEDASIDYEFISTIRNFPSQHRVIAREKVKEKVQNFDDSLIYPESHVLHDHDDGKSERTSLFRSNKVDNENLQQTNLVPN